MNVTEALANRFTCRAFLPDPVDQVTLLEILAAATRAPSWGNTQPWEIFVATGESLERLRQAHAARFDQETARCPDMSAPTSWPEAFGARTRELRMRRAEALGLAADEVGLRRMQLRAHGRFFEAPVLVFLCMDRRLGAWSMFDLGALSQSIMLAARERGLDSAVAFNFAAYPDLVRAELSIPSDLLLVIGIAIGHGDPKSQANAVRSTRRTIEEVVRLKAF